MGRRTEPADPEYVERGPAAHHRRGHRGVPQRDRAARDPRPGHGGSRQEVTELCLSYGLRGLWSLPIRSPDGTEFLGLLGVLPPDGPRPEARASSRSSNACATSPRSRSTATRRTKELGSPRPPRHAHRPAQPGAGPGPSRARARAARQRRRRVDGGGAVRRPRPVQAGERRPRARDGRRAPDRGEPPARQRPCAGRTPSPASAATSSSCCARTSRGEEQAIELAERAAAGVRRSVRAVAGRGHGVGEHRDRGHRPLVRSRVEPAAGRRRRDVPGQAARRRAPRAVRRGHAHAGGLAAAHRAGAAARPRPATSCACCSSPQFDLASRTNASRSRRCSAGTTRCAGSCCRATSCRVAEETGIIVPIGEWVLGRACELLRTTTTDGPGGAPLCGVDQRVGPPAPAARLPRARGARGARLRASTRRRCASRSPRARCSTTSTPRARRSAR